MLLTHYRWKLNKTPCPLPMASSFQAGFNNLDSLWKEVSSLGIVIGRRESRAELRNDVSSRVESLAEKTEGTKHSKTAVLDLLELLLSIFLRSVIEAKWVPCTGVADANVSTNTVSSLLLDADDALVFNPCHTCNDLVNSSSGHVVDGLKGIDVRVGVNSSEVLTSWEGSEKCRPDETNNGKLSDAAVGKLGLTKPLKITHELSLLVKRVVEGGSGDSGETNGVEANISDERSVKSSGGRSKWKGPGSLIPFNIKSGGGLAGLGGGEGGGRAKSGGDNGELHVDK